MTRPILEVGPALVPWFNDMTRPPAARVYLRVSDNVLEEEDFTVWKVRFGGDHCIVHIELVHPGAYARPGDTPHGLDLGSPWTDVVTWSEYDCAGQHPETYHTIHQVTP